MVVDGGKSRARWIPESHNCPGFPHGIGGTALLGKLREQARGFDVRIEDGRIGKLERDGDAFLATAEDGRRWRARFVLLATGVVDVMPAMDGLAEGIARHAVRLCAVCDGYEASDEYKQDREDAAQKILQPALAAATAAGVANPKTHHVLDRYAADGIIETAASCNSDLIVMTSHGRRGVSRVLLGSQTAEVLARSPVPVLVIR